jgi:uncharacterized membrane protein
LVEVPDDEVDTHPGNPGDRSTDVATLTVVKFSSPEGADQALEVLERLQRQELIQIVDAAKVSWPEGRKSPKTSQAVSTLTTGALGGAFWGFLFGLIFFMPVLGMAVGAAAGALGGALTDYGIDDEFIRQTQAKVTPGTSALFVLSVNEVADRVAAELKSLKPELIATNLPADQEAKLRELFSET